MRAGVRDEAPGPLHLLGASLDAHHLARRTDALGEKTETASWSATDLDDTPSLTDPDPVEEPLRFGSELVGLPLEAFLFASPVAEQIGIGLAHADAPPIG